ncbi:MAG TPA: iron ABC transporter permease [Spirochaetia bacterium]|nr:iron ABC transporter permease [Spirochaetia bacterium]
MDELSPHEIGPHRRRRIAPSIPIVVAMLALGIFFYLPLALLIARGMFGGGSFHFGAFLEIFASRYLRGIVLFTIEQALLSTILSIVIGFPMGYLLSVYDFPGRRLLKAFTAVPFALPAITVALGFVIVFGNNGAFNRGIMALFGLSAPPIRILYSLKGILIAHAFYNAPIIARFVSSTWERLPQHYAESARSLGAPRRRIFIDITLPMLAPSIASGATLAFIYSFLSFPIVLILGGARFTTIEVEIYRRAIVETNYTGAAALATLELILALLFTFAYLGIERRYARRTRPGGPRVGRPLFRSGAHRHLIERFALCLFLIAYLVLFMGPIVGVIVNSLTRLEGGGVVFTLSWYREILQPHYSSLIAASPLKSIGNSLLFAGSSAAIALVLGTIVGAALTFRNLPSKKLIETMVMAPLGVSPVALGFAYLWVFARPPMRISGTSMAIIIVHSILAVPFVIRALRPALSRIESRFGEAARSLGASRFRSSIDVVLPLARGAFTTAAVFAFAVSIAETSATLMLTRPDLLTMPIAIYYLLSGRQFGAASAMGVLLIAVIAISFVVIERLGAGKIGGTDGRD